MSIAEFGKIHERIRDDVPKIRDFSGYRSIDGESCPVASAADQLVVCFDVSKEKLDGYAIHVRREAVDREITVSIERRTDQIEEQLDTLANYAEGRAALGRVLASGFGFANR